MGNLKISHPFVWKKKLNKDKYNQGLQHTTTYITWYLILPQR